MSKGLLEAFRSIPQEEKEALADIPSPLILSFAVLDIASRTCGIDNLTAEHITACLEATGVSIKKESISKALARAGDRVAAKASIDGGISYKLMTKGRREIPDLLGAGQVSIVKIDGGKPRTARIKLTLALSRLSGHLKVCDPYYGVRSFDSLDAIPKNCSISFLTVRTSEKASHLNGIIADFRKENPRFEMRLLVPPSDIHDRYVLSSSELFMLGHGLKNIGSKESFIIKLDRSMAVDLLKELHLNLIDDGLQQNRFDAPYGTTEGKRGLIQRSSNNKNEDANMASLNMNGPYDFTSESIDAVVTQKSAGNYALGYTDGDGVFVVKYVGRSDTDLNQELKSSLALGHKQFKFSYASSPKMAFEKECTNYHDFGESEKLDNEIHPRRPDNSDWQCPSCKAFE